MPTEVLVLHQGKTVFHRSYDEMSLENVSVTGGLFHAIFKFSSELDKKGLDSIKLGEDNFYFKAKRKLIFIIKEKAEMASQSQVESVLDQLVERFFDRFPNEENYEETNKFNSFAVICDDIIQIQPTKQGFPLVVEFILKPFKTAPALEIMQITEDNQNSFHELQFFLRKIQKNLKESELKKLVSDGFVIYLPNTKKIAYMVPFDANGEKKNPTHLLSFLLNEKSWFSFYQVMPLINRKVNRIIPILIKYLNKFSDITLTEEYMVLKEWITNWADLNQYVSGLQTAIFEELYKSGFDEKSLSEEQISNNFADLLNKLGGDIDKIIFALLTQRQIVFVGDERENIEKAISGLVSIYPHPSVALFSPEIKDLLLLGTYTENIEYYKERDAVIVDLNSYRVTGGEKNEFCAEMMEELKVMAGSSISDARIVFQSKLSTIFLLVKLVLEIFSMDGDIQEKEIKSVLESYPPATLRLINRMCYGVNEVLAQQIQKIITVKTRFGRLESF